MKEKLKQEIKQIIDELNTEVLKEDSSFGNVKKRLAIVLANNLSDKKVISVIKTSKKDFYPIIEKELADNELYEEIIKLKEILNNN